MKKPNKVNYTISNPISGPSHFPVSRVKSAHKNLQGAVNLFTESNFFDGKNVYVHQIIKCFSSVASIN